MPPSKPTCIVRSAIEEDFGAIATIYAHHVLHGTATFEIEPPSRETVIERWTQVRALGLPFLVAVSPESAETIVGYAYSSPYRPRPAYRFTIEDSIYLDPQHMGRGYGRTLLGELIRLCELGPWREMIAIVGDSANLPSIRLHESFGFTHVGVLRSVGFKFNRWLDTVLMQKPLKP